MKRAALLALTGIDAERFSTLRRRDQLPFTAAAESERGWQDFSLQDAFLLQLMLDLMDGFGIGPSEAKSILYLPPLIHDAAAEPEDAWLGELTWFDEADRCRAVAPFYGTSASLTERLARRKTISRVIIANASRAARAVLARAEELGIAD